MKHSLTQRTSYSVVTSNSILPIKQVGLKFSFKSIFLRKIFGLADLVESAIQSEDQRPQTSCFQTVTLPSGLQSLLLRLSLIISIALLLHPGFGLALSESKQWRSSASGCLTTWRLYLFSVK